METQLRALGQWEVVEGTITAPTTAALGSPTPEETRDLNAWKLRAARAYAEIALRLEDDYGETIAGIHDPHSAWLMLESSYGSSQCGIQSVLDAELMMTRWDGQSPITTHRDHMKSLRTRLAASGQILPPSMFYKHFPGGPWLISQKPHRLEATSRPLAMEEDSGRARVRDRRRGAQNGGVLPSRLGGMEPP